MFSRNVLREIRLSSEKTSAWQGIFAAFRKPVFLFATAAVLLISGHFIIQNQSESVPGTTEIAEVDSLEYIDPATEFESIEMLGELMAVSDPGSLSDEALMNLLF
jgi:hypothetical protein